jgi:integrase
MGTGSVYRRKEKRCLQPGCKSRRPKACEAAGHPIKVVTLPIWWIRYSHHGQSFFESSGTTSKTEATKLLNERLGKLAEGEPPPKKVKFTFTDAVTLLVNNYKMNGRRSLTTLNSRLDQHLKPFFGDRLLDVVTDDLITAYVVKRQEDGAVNGTINRELTALKRMFTLARRAKKIRHAPFIEMLKENNARKGFFEAEQFESVKNHLPAHMQSVAAFAFITGWRTPSEVLPLQWRHVDFQAGEVRLDPGVTKNDEPRVFPFTAELRRVLEAQREAADRLKREDGIITPSLCVLPPAQPEVRRPRPESRTPDHGERFQQGVGRGADRGRLPRSHPARLPPHGCAEP